MVRVAVLVTAVVVALVSFASCSGSAPTSTSPDPVQHGKLTIAGQVRTYRLFRPHTISGRHAALVVALHPCAPGANGDGMAAATHFDEQASSARFVVVYPDGIDGCWNVLGANPERALFRKRRRETQDALVHLHPCGDAGHRFAGQRMLGHGLAQMSRGGRPGGERQRRSPLPDIQPDRKRWGVPCRKECRRSASP